jgi:hypothetical protein
LRDFLRRTLSSRKPPRSCSASTYPVSDWLGPLELPQALGCRDAMRVDAELTTHEEERTRLVCQFHATLDDDIEPCGGNEVDGQMNGGEWHSVVVEKRSVPESKKSATVAIMPSCA